MKHILFFILLSSTLFSQENKFISSAPVFNGSSINTLDRDRLSEIINKTLDFLTKNTNELFLKRMNLKENDSIEFQIEYIVDKEGNILKDSTKIYTSITNFNNFYSTVINNLPKFIPAQNEYLQNIDYKIAFIGQFYVKNNKLEYLQHKFDKDLVINTGDSNIYPTAIGCEKASDKKTCINDKIESILTKEFIKKKLKKHLKSNIRIFILFEVDEFGKFTVKDIKGSKTITQEELEVFKNELIELFKSFPKIEPAIKNGIPVRIKLVYPITIYNFK